MEYAKLYQWGRQQLEEAGIPDAGNDARLLLEWCCGTDRNTLLAHGDRAVSEEETKKYKEAADRRRSREPLQYITGRQEFMGLQFEVDGNVLVPRQDTEILVEEVLKNLHDGMRILDLCTGSGCILLSLLHYSNDCTGVGTDLSAGALQVARRNACRILPGTSFADAADGSRDQQKNMHNMHNMHTMHVEEARVTFLEGDLFQGLEDGERFDMIVSNPPYIRTDVIDTLMPEVREHEPLMALDGGKDGLFFYRQITARAGGYLAGGGMLFFEIGYDQGEDVSRLMEAAGYTQVEVFKDYAGNDRVVQGVWSACSPGRP